MKNLSTIIGIIIGITVFVLLFIGATHIINNVTLSIVDNTTRFCIRLFIWMCTFTGIFSLAVWLGAIIGGIVKIMLDKK